MARVNILDSSNHYYDNSLSGLSAVNTQDAIDEIKVAVETGGASSILDLGIVDGTNGQLLTTDGSGNFTFEDAPIALPSQSGFTGYVLTTNGSTASWTNNITVNSATSSKWQTPRTVTLSGDASGSMVIDGSDNVTLPVTIADDSHTHDGRYYTESEADSLFVNVSGDTLTGNLNFGESNKALFGANDDLQIYNDGIHSYIHDAGIGDLVIKAGSRLLIQSADGNTTGAIFDEDGAVQLNFNNVQKLVTTSTGVSVTGDVSATAFIGDGSNLTGVGAQQGAFWENDTTITASYTITAGKNAMTAGPITVADGVVITVPDGSTWTIV